MAKFKVEWQSEKIIKTLTFMGKKFLNTWVPTESGSRTLEKSFEYQVKTQFSDLPEDITELLGDIDCLDEDEVLEALEQLSLYEEEQEDEN